MHRKAVGGCGRIGILLCAVCLAGNAHAADWRPERGIEIIVGTGVGGGQDKSARIVQRVLQERKLVAASPQVTITVVNKPGGGGAVGWNYLNQHAGDAHYVEIGNPTLLTNHIVGRSPMTYTDVSIIATLFTESVALSVRAESPIKSIRDLAERLRNDVTSVSFSVGSSLGSANHIAMARLARLAGADPRRMKAVVFQGGGEAITALLGGHVDLIASAANNVVPHMASGKIRVLGVTSEKRLEGSFAAVPTLREQGTTSPSAMAACLQARAASRRRRSLIGKACWRKWWRLPSGKKTSTRTNSSRCFSPASRRRSISGRSTTN
jgi:putative tricarboxylic transport membrane protein